MRKTIWKSIAVLVLAVLLAFPVYAAQLQERSGFIAEDGLTEEGEIFTFPQPRRMRGVLPEQYDARAEGYITSVKSQGSQPVCWTFGSLGAMEANLLKNGFGAQDLSEQHMYYATATGGGNDYGFSRANKMGNRLYAGAYLMRGVMQGAAQERDDAYDSVLAERDAAETAAVMPAFRAQNLLLLSGGSEKAPAEVLKQAIMTYGAVGASMYWKGTATAAAGTGSTTNYNAATAAYYSANVQSLNHMVLIVGWDDAFPAESFHASCRPSENGAWLVKNSWGEAWGDNGYFWISYEDANFPTGNFVIDGAMPYSNREVVYETEYLTASAGVSGGQAYAKAFTAQSEGEKITAVRVYLPDAETELTVSVYTDGMYSAAEPAAEKAFSTVYPGWYTIELDEPVLLGAADSDFCVRVYFADTDKHIGVDKVTSNPAGQNYYLSGNQWAALDGTSYNLAIKAIAESAATRGDANGDGAVNGKDVTELRRYFAGGYGVTIEEKAADANLDKKVTAKDITFLRRYLAGGYGVTLSDPPESGGSTNVPESSTPWVPIP